MELSIVLAAYNEGELLERTVQTCLEVYDNADFEIVIADDGSTDDSVDRTRQRYPLVRIVRSPEKIGCSPAKHRGACAAQGEMLLFLDAHCKPEPGAIDRLVAAVKATRGRAVIVPTVSILDPVAWQNNFDRVGQGYRVDLLELTWEWIPPDQLTRRGPYLETPSLIGCCVMVARELYERLGGFDQDMLVWGVEDVEFGVKSWLTGHPVLCEPRSVIGHRFQDGFINYRVDNEYIVANRLRMACKIFGSELWPAWLDRFRSRHDPELWQKAWAIFCERRGSAEQERCRLRQFRIHDEFSYAAKFGLNWPRRPLRLRQREAVDAV